LPFIQFGTDLATWSVHSVIM